MSSFKFVMYWGWLLWDLCECQAEFGDTAKITGHLGFVMYVKSMQACIE